MLRQTLRREEHNREWTFKYDHFNNEIKIMVVIDMDTTSNYALDINYAKRVFLEPPDRSTESHWRTEIRAGGAGPRAIEANTNIKSHLS